MQSQFETHQDSQDQLAPGGVLLNKDRFLVRRARLRVIGAWRFTEAQIEINGDTTSGFNVNLQKAEASVFYRPDPAKVPIAQATLGLFDTPFGYELVESPRSRPFMERTTMSRAFWAGEPDLGLRLSGGLGFVRWTIAGVNGYPLGSPTYAGQDPFPARTSSSASASTPRLAHGSGLPATSRSSPGTGFIRAPTRRSRRSSGTT